MVCDEMHLAARGGASWQEVLDVGTAVAVATPVLDGVAELITAVGAAATGVAWSPPDPPDDRSSVATPITRIAATPSSRNRRNQ